MTKEGSPKSYCQEIRPSTIASDNNTEQVDILNNFGCMQIVTADTADDAVDAVPALRKLINVDQVNLIVGPSSLEAQAVLPILQQSKIPDMIVRVTPPLTQLT